MAKKPTDITGQRFCRLTVIGIAGKSKDGRVVWDCVCDCGKHIIAKYADLKKRQNKVVWMFKSRNDWQGTKNTRRIWLKVMAYLGCYAKKMS